MTKTQAHALLDRQKEQRNITALPSAIDYALFLTGDLRRDALHFSEGMDKSLQQKNHGGWQSQSDDLVAQSGRYYGSQAWFDVHYGIKGANE